MDKLTFWPGKNVWLALKELTLFEVRGEIEDVSTTGTQSLQLIKSP